MTLLVMFACAAALFSEAKCHAQSPPEEASFRVAVGNGQGSGTGISENLVLTNAHVGDHLDAPARIWHTLSRQEWQGQVVSMYPGADLAIIYVPTGGLPWVKINQEGFKPDLPVYSYGYGRNGILRKGSGQVTGTTGDRRAEGAPHVAVWNTGLTIEPGDSGSGIFNADGELVGVNWGAARDTDANAATSARHVVDICNHFVETQCSGGRCPTGGMGGMFQGPGQSMGAGQMVPVRPPVASESPPPAAKPPVIAGPAPVAPPAAPPAIDADKLADALLEKLAGDPRFKGAKGDAGPAGPPGKDGRDGHDAEVDYDRIIAAVESRIDYQKIAGLVNVTGPQLPAASQHVVLVADPNATYWPRLSSDLQRAREAYHRIEVQRPPADQHFGELPALAWYENGVPMRVVRGTYEVTNELSTIARGEATPLN